MPGSWDIWSGLVGSKGPDRWRSWVGKERNEVESEGELGGKTPTNRDLLRGFIGSVGFLANDIPNIRIPLGILSAITGDTVPFHWGYTEQQAFEDAKRLTNDAREHSWRPISYEDGAPPVWMVTDGCSTGIAGDHGDKCGFIKKTCVKYVGIKNVYI